MNMHRKEIDAVMTKQPFFPVWLAGTMHPTRTPGKKRVRCTRQRSPIQVAESLQKSGVGTRTSVPVSYVVGVTDHTNAQQTLRHERLHIRVRAAQRKL